jgi:hypothetical protein
MTAERAHEHAHSHGHRPQPGPGIGSDMAELPFNARTGQKRRGIAKRPECDDDKARFEARLGVAKVKGPKK